MSGVGTLNVESGITDSNGKAQVNLTMGELVEEITVVAQIFNTGKTVIFTATSYILMPLTSADLEGLWLVKSSGAFISEGDTWNIYEALTTDYLISAKVIMFVQNYDGYQTGSII